MVHLTKFWHILVKNVGVNHHFIVNFVVFKSIFTKNVEEIIYFTAIFGIIH